MDYDAGNGDMVRAWVVYPERAEKAPVVVVLHEIYALTAVAPSLWTGRGRWPSSGLWTPRK